MIVHCPSCHTRYRHDPEAVTATLAECGNCEETVPLVVPKRRYALLSPRSSRSVGPGTVASTAGSVAEMPLTFPESAESAATPESSGRPAPERPGSVLADLGIAFAPSVVAAVLAYYLAGWQNLDPITWAALGGAMGLLLGWACLIWTRRKD